MQLGAVKVKKKKKKLGMFRPVLVIFFVLRIEKEKNSFLFLLCHCNNGSNSWLPQHPSIRRTFTG